jgi:hypothetical protein
MSFLKSLIVMLVLALPAAMAEARQDALRIEQRLSAEQLRETGLDTLTPAQLARLNELLSAPVAVSVATPAGPAMASAPSPAGAPAASAVTAPAAPAPQPGIDKPLFGFNDAPIKSRLKGTLTGWEEGTVFTLENGQQWKVLKGHMKLPKPITDPDIRVVPGLVGRWFLEVHEDYPKARVYLIN